MLSQARYEEIIEQYSRGANVTQFLVNQEIPIDFDVIELLYDLQAGTYTSFAKDNEEFYKSFVEEISQIISPFVESCESILDCGTGEGSTLVPLLQFHKNLSQIFAIDSSWSRLSWANQNLESAQMRGVALAVADMKNIPMEDDSVDIVLTIHALEPNGGSENIIVSELSRVAKKFVILVEPDYLEATPQQQIRMQSLNYIGDLRPFFPNNNLELVSYRGLSNFINPLNKSCLFVLKKKLGDPHPRTEAELSWVDPINKVKGTDFGGGIRFQTGLWYPRLFGIPFLRTSDGKFTHSPAKRN